MSLKFLTRVLKQLPAKAASRVRNSAILNSKISFMEETPRHYPEAERVVERVKERLSQESPAQSRRKKILDTIKDESYNYSSEGVSKRQVSEWAREMRAAARRAK